MHLLDEHAHAHGRRRLGAQRIEDAGRLGAVELALGGVALVREGQVERARHRRPRAAQDRQRREALEAEREARAAALKAEQESQARRRSEMRRSAEPLITGGSGSFNDGSSSSSSGDEFEHGQSRYASDFKERRVLGRGGCGEVCEVLNRLDRRTYAIKKVRLTGGASRRDARRQLREVEALAAAFHPHVVRYYQAWIEGLEDAPIQEEFSLLDGFSDEDDDSDDGIMSSSSNLTGKPATTTLYIQMEFCAATLRQLIDTRRLEQRRDDQWRLLRQILLALQYLHDKLLVHRDLKPANIMLVPVRNQTSGAPRHRRDFVPITSARWREGSRQSLAIILRIP